MCNIYSKGFRCPHFLLLADNRILAAADFCIGAETPALGMVMFNRRTAENEDENNYDKGT